MNYEKMTVKEAAEFLKQSARHVQQQCSGGKLPAEKVAGKWSINVTGTRQYVNYIKTAAADGVEDISESKRQIALRRRGVIEQFRKFERNFNGSRTAAMETFCATKNISRGTLYRWMESFRVSGLIGLVDTRGAGGAAGEFSKEAAEEFKSLYLTQQKLSAAICRRNIQFINSEQKKGWRIPSLRSIYNYIKTIPLPVRVLHRDGLEAYNALCAPYISIDPASIKPGQIWVGDHHQLNCLIRHRGKWIRPWLTAWEDMASRKLIGTWICETPNQSTILQAFKRGVKKYGPPDVVKIDNGRDYDSEMWTGTTKMKRRRVLKKGYLDEEVVAGLYAMLDIRVSFAIPYKPQSKRIERLFDTVDRSFTKTIETYCGKNSAVKPDDLNQKLKTEAVIQRAYGIESFTKIFERYVTAYNQSSHSGAGMEGRSPDAVFSTRTSRRVLAEGVLDYIGKVWSGKLTVGKNGVRIKGLYYGEFNMDLAAYQGRKVRCGYDPDDIRQVYVYDAATWKLITIAEQNRLIGYGAKVSEESLRDAMKQKTRVLRINRQFRKTRNISAMDLTSLTIKAMNDAADRPKPPDQGGPARIRPVITPLNDQIEEHKRIEARRFLRKAAGAESAVGIDLSKLNPKRENTKLGLFDDDG